MVRTAETSPTTELIEYALECLKRHCTTKKPRLQRTAVTYVLRAMAAFDAGIASASCASLMLSRCDRIKTIIRELVDADDAKTNEIIAATDWAKTTRDVLLYAVRKYRTGEILGKQLSDYYQDAVVQLLDRGRHLPHYRGVDLTAFLCETLRSLIDHAIEKATRQPVMLRIVRGKANAAAGEYSEHLLPPATS